MEKKSTSDHGSSKLRHRLVTKPRKVSKIGSDRSPEAIGRLLRTVGPPPIPKCAALGFHDYPFLIKVASIGMFCAIIGILLPYWVWVWVQDTNTYAVFGLWTYCQENEEHCNSIHDNIIPGKDVPVWFIMVQWSYFIGVVMSLIVLTILMHNYADDRIDMSPTVYTAAECISAIGAFQKFVSLYTFTSYFDELNFLHQTDATVDFHAAFYCSVITFICDVIIAVVLFLDEDIGPVPVTNNILIKGANEYEKLNVFKQGADTYLYNPDTSEMEYHLHTS